MNKIVGMNDGGSRVVFGENTAQRESDADKPRMELLSPLALIRLGGWAGKGAQKYEERNWEKGIPYMRCVGSILRHVMQFVLRDDSEDHLAAIMCNAMFLTHYDELGMSEFDDRPHYNNKREETL